MAEDDPVPPAVARARAVSLEKPKREKLRVEAHEELALVFQLIRPSGDTRISAESRKLAFDISDRLMGALADEPFDVPEVEDLLRRLHGLSWHLRGMREHQSSPDESRGDQADQLAAEAAPAEAAGTDVREMRESVKRGDSRSVPPADVAALHGTPVTLGVVFALVGGALAVVLSVAALLWAQIESTEDKLSARIDKTESKLSTEVSGLRNEVSALTAKVAVLETTLKLQTEMLAEVRAELRGMRDELGKSRH